MCVLARVCFRQVFLVPGMYSIHHFRLKTVSSRLSSQRWYQGMGWLSRFVRYVPCWPGLAKWLCAAISGNFDDVTRPPFSWFQYQRGLPSTDGCGRFFRRRQLRWPCKYVDTSDEHCSKNNILAMKAGSFVSVRCRNTRVFVFWT